MRRGPFPPCNLSGSAIGRGRLGAVCREAGPNIAASSTDESPEAPHGFPLFGAVDGPEPCWRLSLQASMSPLPARRRKYLPIQQPKGSESL